MKTALSVCDKEKACDFKGKRLEDRKKHYSTVGLFVSPVA